MSEPPAKPRWRSFGKYLLIVATSGLLLLGALAWYATTDSFQVMVRQRLVAELERVTGGRVELGGIHTIPFRFQVDIRDLTIHGREAPGEIPYAHVDRLVAHINLSSALGAEIGFHSVVLQRPVIHLIVYPDGTTNQPEPKVKAVAPGTPLQQLFSFSMGRLEVRNGELVWNQRRIPLDFVANDISASMDYSLLHRKYEGSLLLGKINTRFDDYRPVAWMTEVHFGLSQETVEVNSLKATSGRSHLETSGRLVNFRAPAVVGDYNFTVDLGEAGAVSRRSELRHGTLQATGHGAWSAADFFTSGKLQVKDLDWQAEGLNLRGVSLNTGFAVKPQQLDLPDINARLLGGEMSGDAQILNWLTPSTANKAKKSAEKGTVRLRLKDLSAGAIATALSSSARPLRQMNLAGSATATVETRWTGARRNAETQVALDVVAPNGFVRGQLPLTAHARALYRSAPAELEVSEFNASTRATQVRASGTLSTHAAVNLSLTTTDIGEWEPVLEAVGYQEGLPFRMRGRASFTGTATGRITEIDFAGKLQSQNFNVVILATARRPRRTIQWDSLAADVRLSPHGFAAQNGTLHHGDAIVHFDITAGLEERQFTGASPFNADVQIQKADAAEVLALAGYEYPVSGRMDLLLQASGTRSAPQGQGAVHVTNAVAHGEPVQQLDSKFSFSRDQFSLQDLRATQNEALVTGGGTYDFLTHAFRWNLEGNNFDLARFPALQSGRVPIDGRMSFVAQSSGTPDAPIINAKIRLQDLAFNHQREGDYVLDAVTQGADLQISGQSQFTNEELNLDGNVHLRGDWPAKLHFHFNHLDVDSLLTKYLKLNVTAHSTAAGEIQVQGPLRDPRELQISGSLNELSAQLSHVQVRNNGPIGFVVSGQTLSIQRFRLLGEGTDLEVGGKVQLSGEHQLDLHAEGHADLALIHSLNPDFTSSGAVAVNLTAGGSVTRPTMQGHLQIAGGSIQYSDLPSALSEINGSLVFNQDRLEIETLTAHVGGGQVAFSGFATAYNGQLTFDLALHGQDVRLRYPPGVSSMTDAELRWAGTPAASTISGNATITKLAVAPGFDFSSYLALSSQTAALPQTNPLLNRIRMDVHIVTTPELQMQTAAVRLSGDADLRLRGTAAKPVLLGRADVVEGDLYFNGAKYRMERGDITFTNPVTTTPVLDLQAATRVRDYDITVNLNGPVDKMNLTYHSEPPLPTADIISLLAVGQTQEQSAQLQQSGQSPFVAQASSAVLAEALNSALSNRSHRLFGISHIKIDPQGLNTETTPTQTTPLPAVTIEQQVRDNITLTYTTNVAQTSQQIIQGEYNITRDLSIVGIRDYNGVVSFEVRLRRRKK
jgi:translocation and assembly module TamB